MVLKQKGAMPSFSRHESTKIIRKMVFLFALIAGRATSFVLKQKEAKIQDDNDPSALRGQHPARRSRRAYASSGVVDGSW